MELPEIVVGVLLAGGRSSRMGGGDKCLLPLAGRPILARVIDRLRPQVSDLVINANGDLGRFSSFGVPVIEDRLGGYAGPLAGIHAGMAWSRINRPQARFIVTAATDTPLFPPDLVERFAKAFKNGEPKLVVARSEGGVHPVFGLWPLALAPDLESALRSGVRKVGDWVKLHNGEEAAFPSVEIGGRTIDPFFNINTPGELAEAEALLSKTAA